MAKQYATVVGIVVVLVGVLGLFTGPTLLGFNSDILEDVIHLVTGGLMAYVGLGMRDPGPARSVVGVLGIVYLVVGVLGFVIPMLFGLLPTGYGIADNILHLALGVLGIMVGYVMKSEAPAMR